MSSAAEVGSKNWDDQVLKSELPVLVDFWAPWCGPCRMLSPTVDALATELDGQLKVFKCNVDENHEVAGRYSVMNIPQLLLFKEGRVVMQIVGSQSKDAISAKLKDHLG